MADTPQITTTRLTLAEFDQQYDAEGPFEIIGGRVIKLMPLLAGHCDIANNLAFSINTYTLPNKIGKAFTETPFVIPDEYDSQWVKGSRIPDVMYYQMERLVTYKNQVPDWQEKPYLLVPDLAVEIVSKHDSYSDIDQKISAYVRDGVQLVWVIDPRRQTITVYMPDSKQFTHLTIDDTVTAGDVIPGFALSVATILE